MLANYHTHTIFSDGKNTPEELINYAIEKGFKSLGFSDHSFVEHDQRYCMQNIEGYIAEIMRLKAKYVDKIQIYLGIEEDASAPVNRLGFDYRIGSLHYIFFEGKYYPFDSKYDYLTTCAQLFRGDDLALAECYYDFFCNYLEKEKPDIIGHFDLITKFDETKKDRFLHNEKYWELAEKFVLRALNVGSMFEVNTGLITRGFRTLPCPHVRLLKIIAEKGGRIVLSSDAHRAENLCSYFVEMKTLLKRIGFDGVYFLYNGNWEKERI